MRRTILALLLAVTALPALAQTNEPVPLQLESKILGETRVVLVRTPPSYRAGSKRYPVLYMTDGPAQLPHTVATIDFLARNGRVPEMIVVGIANTDRTRDLSPTHVESTAFDGQTFRFPSSGGANKFLSFIETELIPAIESKYRTSPYRVFAGHSFGGLFALYSMYERPKLFNAWIAVSPTLPWDNGWPLRRGEEFLRAHKELPAHLYLTIGDEGEGLKQAFDAYKRLLVRYAPKGFEWHLVELKEEDHGSIVLPTHLAALRKIFEPWRFPLGIRDDAATLFDRAKTHYAKLSQRVGYTISIPEATANLIGYRLLQVDRVDDAINVFRANAAAYADSANVYDSLGEALEKKGDVAAARSSYEKAWTLGKAASDPNTNIYKANLDRVSASK